MKHFEFTKNNKTTPQMYSTFFIVLISNLAFYSIEFLFHFYLNFLFVFVVVVLVV